MGTGKGITPAPPPPLPEDLLAPPGLCLSSQPLATAMLRESRGALTIARAGACDLGVGGEMPWWGDLPQTQLPTEPCGAGSPVGPGRGAQLCPARRQSQGRRQHPLPAPGSAGPGRRAGQGADESPGRPRGVCHACVSAPPCRAVFRGAGGQPERRGGAPQGQRRQRRGAGLPGLQRQRPDAPLPHGLHPRADRPAGEGVLPRELRVPAPALRAGSCFKSARNHHQGTGSPDMVSISTI